MSEEFALLWIRITIQLTIISLKSGSIHEYYRGLFYMWTSKERCQVLLSFHSFSEEKTILIPFQASPFSNAFFKISPSPFLSCNQCFSDSFILWGLQPYLSLFILKTMNLFFSQSPVLVFLSFYHKILWKSAFQLPPSLPQFSFIEQPSAVRLSTHCIRITKSSKLSLCVFTIPDLSDTWRNWQCNNNQTVW